MYSESLTQMDAANLDQFVMLLSTDWFLPYWSTIGIDLPEGQKEFVQRGCREIVNQIISGAKQYYLISFAPERLEETQRRFRKLLNQAGVSENFVARVKFLLSPDQESSGTRWLLMSMAERLLLGSKSLPVNDTIPVLAPKIKDTLKAWHDCRTEHADFSDLCLHSGTAWDDYIRSLNPELQDVLAAYVNVDLIGEGEFQKLLRTVAKLSATERTELTEWYCVARALRCEHVVSQIPGTLSALASNE